MRYSETRLIADDSTELFVRHYQPLAELGNSNRQVCDSQPRRSPSNPPTTVLKEVGASAASISPDNFAETRRNSSVTADQLPADGTDSVKNLVIVHGASEHGARYDHVAREFVARGWNVIVGDLRGHGRSGGLPTHVRDFRLYLQDLDSIWRHFCLRPERTALLGHSFGALVSARYAQTRLGAMAALVLMAPLLRLNVAIDPLTIAFGKVLSYIVPSYRFQSRVDVSATTRSQQVLEQRAQDPLIHRSVTAGWYFQMKAAIQQAWQQAPGIELPVCVLQGALDSVVDPLAIEPWLDQVSSNDKQFHLLPEHLHELHNEPDWPQTIALVADWLEERVTVPTGKSPAQCS